MAVHEAEWKDWAHNEGWADFEEFLLTSINESEAHNDIEINWISSTLTKIDS